MNSLMTRFLRDAKALALEYRDKWGYMAVSGFCLLIYLFSQARDSVVHVYQMDKGADFKDARVLGSQNDSIYEGKERLLAKTMRELKDEQTALKESNQKLLAKIEEMEKGKGVPAPLPSSGLPAQGVSEVRSEIKVEPSSDQFKVTQGGSMATTAFPVYSTRVREKGGASVISFPVKDVVVEKTEGVVLPSGSYVKAKLMTGVEAPEGRAYPALLQLDYAYIVPNRKRLDLSGCFMIAKSQGDLSTERVQMQATKLSCVSKEGRMFEREVNGFVADDKDNSFAVMGSVNSKQDRVAAMAFLSSIVDGVGKAIQQAQTTQQTTPQGAAQSMITGDQMAYIGAGGASSAAGMVTQWYLKQAQNLLPTINVGSGQDIWVVMQDSVKLPNDYFRMNTGGTSENIYTYFSRIVD